MRRSFAESNIVRIYGHVGKLGVSFGHAQGQNGSCLILAAANLLPEVLVRVGLVLCAGGGRRPPSAAAEPAALFLAHSETEVRLCCPHLNPLGRGGPESFARLALTRVPS
jgi:hypothetical protein